MYYNVIEKSQNLMPEVMQNIDKSDESLLIFWGRFFLNRMMTSLSAKKRKWQVKHFCNVCIIFNNSIYLKADRNMNKMAIII